MKKNTTCIGEISGVPIFKVNDKVIPASKIKTVWKEPKEKVLYLTKADISLTTLGFILMAIAFTVGIVLRFIENTACYYISFGLFMAALIELVFTLIWLTIGEACLRKEHWKTRKNFIREVVYYCYPTITEEQYKEYYRILTDNLKKNKRNIKNMVWEDFLPADKWAQTQADIPLERKWGIKNWNK